MVLEYQVTESFQASIIYSSLQLTVMERNHLLGEIETEVILACNYRYLELSMTKR